jgi:collagenase-like PrtC family protease
VRILSPVDRAEEVAELLEAGADELYCGVLEERWHESYPVISINRRPAGKGHFRSFEELARAVEVAHGSRVPVFFAVNEHYYTNEQYPLVTEYVDRALKTGVDGLIVSDYGLMAFLREERREVELHVSTGGAVFNWRAAQFFQNLGASRITLPRHLSLGEIGDIVAGTSGIEFAVFILNSRCINVDGLCTFQHGLSGKNVPPLYRNACMLPCEIMPYPSRSPDHHETERLVARQRIWEKVHVDDYPCGACALYELKSVGVTSVKIVGRGNPTERKLRDLHFLRGLLDLLEKERPTCRAYREAARKCYRETYKRPCRAYMCYYPSVMES